MYISPAHAPPMTSHRRRASSAHEGTNIRAPLLSWEVKYLYVFTGSWRVPFPSPRAFVLIGVDCSSRASWKEGRTGRMVALPYVCLGERGVCDLSLFVLRITSRSPRLKSRNWLYIELEYKAA
jgi:hypothetical protein